jgi:type VI secretion system protein ImpC
MLWGHPALLALTVLACHGAPLTIDDLPFHHYVDEHGDSVALPCTDRLMSTHVASLLREAGINAVMAHKGEALVRFNGLEAINGDGLAVAGAAPKKAPSDTRFAVQSKIDAKGEQVSAGFAPAVRKGGPVLADEPVDEPAEEPVDEPAEEPVPEPEGIVDETEVVDESAARAPTAEAGAPNDELANLLASLDEPAEPVGDEPTANATMDPELEALLKSLG